MMTTKNWDNSRPESQFSTTEAALNAKPTKEGNARKEEDPNSSKDAFFSWILTAADEDAPPHWSLPVDYLLRAHLLPISSRLLVDCPLEGNFIRQHQPQRRWRSSCTSSSSERAPLDSEPRGRTLRTLVQSQGKSMLLLIAIFFGDDLFSLTTTTTTMAATMVLLAW